MASSKLDMLLFKLDECKQNNNTNTFDFMIITQDELTSDEINKLYNLKYTVIKTDVINEHTYYTITW